MSRLIAIDGATGEGGGQVLRTALGLAAVTGQGFEITRIRANRARSGLRPQHLAAVRAAAMACGARVGGVFEGSPDLRFEPGAVAAGDFRFEIATAGAATLVLETVLVPLATASEPSQVAATGGTHVPLSPSYHYFARHVVPMLGRLGLHVETTLMRAGFLPSGGGEIAAVVRPWPRSASPAPGSRGLVLERRGALLEVRCLSGAARLKGSVAERQRDAVQARLWEARRIEPRFEVQDVPAASPGSFLLLEAVFETGRAAFGYLGQKGLRAERLGDRAARELLKFLDGPEGAVDSHLADQLALPLAVAGGGGLVTTPEVTQHLVTVAQVLTSFGVGARTSGRLGGPGALEVDAVDPCLGRR